MKHPFVVVITGASAGLGRATAREFARQGAKLGLIARGREGLEAAKAEVEKLGGVACIAVADVANPEEVEAAASQIETTLGPIDVWVNNAMASVFSPVAEMEAAEYLRVTEVTYLGCVYGTMAALRRMNPRGRGHLIFVGSALAYRGIPLQSAYCAAKHAIEGFFDSLRSELIHDGGKIHATMVQMPALNTPQFGWVKSRLPRKAQPVPPIFAPEVGARAVVWAATHRRREIYVGWPTVKAILGNKLFPSLLDHFLAKTGYDSQQYDGSEDPNRPHNLWSPVTPPADGRGNFSDREQKWSTQLWTTLHRNAIAAAIALLGLAGLSWLLEKSRLR
jgi:short-subunit dehydrogenase